MTIVDNPAPSERPADVPAAYLDLLDRCQERLDYKFKEPALLYAALTHASGAGTRLESNERLEFLGDSILGFVISDMLFHEYLEYLEGDLTKVKSVVVSRQTCARISKALGLREFLILGKGMASNPSVPPSLLADVYEALIAAIYEDGGMKAARRFILEHMRMQVELAVTGQTGGNYKSILQQLAQRKYGSTPIYQPQTERGPDHAKLFEVAAVVNSQRYSPAWGRNKKEAEQRAACNALCEMRGEQPPFNSE